MRVLLVSMLLFVSFGYSDTNDLAKNRDFEAENKILLTKLKAAQKEIESLQAENKKLKALLKNNNIEIKNDRRRGTPGILAKMQLGYRFKMNADQSLVVQSIIKQRYETSGNGFAPGGSSVMPVGTSGIVCRIEQMDSENKNCQFVLIGICSENIQQSAVTGSKLPGGIVWQVVGTKTITIVRDGESVKETVYEIAQVQ